MIRTTTRRSMFLMAMAGLASTAAADLPEVMDLVPAGSLGGVVAPSLSSLDRAAINLFTAVGMPVLSTPSQMFAETGFSDGIDHDRPFAVVVAPGPMDTDEPPMVIVVPTTDADALFGQFDATDAGHGMLALEMDGQTVYAKEVGNGYAIAGPVKDAVASFNVEGGQLGAHKSMMGQHAVNVAESSSVFGYISMPALAPLIEDQWDEFEAEFREGMAEGMAQAGQMNPAMADLDPEQLEAAADAFLGFAESFISDGMYGVFGLQAGSMGVGAQMAMDFKPGSDTANMLKTGGNSNDLLKALPDKPYIFAGAMDMSDSATAECLEMCSQFMALAGLDENAMPGLMGLIEGTKGSSSAMYVTEGGLMAGLFSGMLKYVKVDNTAEYIESFEQMTANGGGMIPVPMSFERNTGDLNGKPVHTWGVDIPMDHNNPMAMQMMQISQMLFGGQHIGGSLVETRGGFYQTMGGNLSIVTDATDGKGGSLATNDALGQVREMLPHPATGEVYVSLGSIYNMAAPMAAMMGIQLNTPVPQDLPPIGMTIATGKGGMSAGMFTPAPVLRAGMGVAMELQAMGMGGGHDDHDHDHDEAPF